MAHFIDSLIKVLPPNCFSSLNGFFKQQEEGHGEKKRP